MNTEKPIENTVTNTEPVKQEVVQQPVQQQVISQPTVEKVKKPRKPLSEESKAKRAEVLKKARAAKEAKLLSNPERHLKTVKTVVVTKQPDHEQIEMVLRKVMADVKIKGKKTDDEKITKKVNKKLQVEAIVVEKLTDYDQHKQQEKQEKQKLKKSNLYKNIF